jgi:seryl-tRNA synthetase
MLDVKFLRQQPERMRDALIRRHEPQATLDMLDRFLLADGRWREITAQASQLKAERNAVSARVAESKRTGQDTSPLIEETRVVGERIRELDERLRELEAEMNDILLRLPNVPHESVPDGAGEEDNRDIRHEGTPRTFSFVPRPHWEIGSALGILDFERAAKVTGSRFVFYVGLGARLERALLNFMTDVQCGEHGYTEIWPPYMVNRQSMVGTGNLPKFEEDVFKLQDPEYYLIPTAEVPITNMHRDEILTAADLPVRYAGFSACFRSEAGAAGRDTRGLIRVHQFNKLELVKFTRPEDSYQEFATLLRDCEVILQKLDLPYRVVDICTGDLGFKETKKLDLEVWLPSAGTYREISSVSNFEDFQARRANIRFRRAEKAKPEYVHTLNGSGLALGRTMAAILENYQTEDGIVQVPAVLQPYLGGLREIRGR